MGAFDLVETLHRIGQRYWQDTHDAVSEELDFCDGKHFAVNEDEHQKDRRRIQFSGQELFNVVRHKSAQVSAWPRHVEAKPIDREMDPDAAEMATLLIEWETGNPLKMFDDYCEIVITGAIAARYWLMALDFDPLLGEWGEICFRPLDPRHCLWEPGYHSPHDVGCGWFIEERRVSLAWVRKQGWGLASEVRPDADTRESTKNIGDDFPADTGEEQKVTLYFCWLKNDRTTIDVDLDGQTSPLPEDQRYLRCKSCGWKSDVGVEDESKTCPKCGQVAERVDEMQATESRRQYADGRRLIITAPNGGLNEPLYDGAWTVPGLRSFPVGMLSCYLHPSKPVGPSDTILNWSGQLMADLLMTTAGQRVLEFRNYYLLPELGVNDWQGKRFEFRDDQYNVMYYKDAITPASVQTMQGSALDPSWRIYWQATRETLLSNQGISDLGIGPQDSKDIAASTVQQLTQMGEIPVEHLKRRWHRELGRIYGILWDMIRATYTEGRIARLNLPEGESKLVKAFGDELPNFDFVITDGAGMSGLDKSRVEALTMMIQAVQLPPEVAIELMAEASHMPPSTLRKVKAAMAQAKQEQMAMMEQQQAMEGQQAEMQQEQAQQGLALKQEEHEQKLGQRESEFAQKMEQRGLEMSLKMAGGLRAGNSVQGGNGASAPPRRNGPPAGKK